MFTNFTGAQVTLDNDCYDWTTNHPEGLEDTQKGFDTRLGDQVKWQLIKVARIYVKVGHVGGLLIHASVI